MCIGQSGAMGSVFSSTTLAPMAVRLAWICQMLLDPKYSYIELDSERQIARPPDESSSPQQATEQQPVAAASTQTTAPESSENGSLHQQNRKRRAAQLSFRSRPSSLDTALIIRKSKSSLLVASTPAALHLSSSSVGCSSDSDADSEPELRLSQGGSSTTLGMSAEEEEAFRLTLGRGYFSRSKKDRFLNHLRLEKRLNNDLNNGCLGVACNDRQTLLQRRHSGDLHRIC